MTRGETLGHIARRYKTTVKVLAAENRLGKDLALRVGQVLVVPGANASSGPSWQRYARAPKRRGFLDVSTHSSRYRGLVIDGTGRLNPAAVRALNALFGAGGSHPRMPDRLIRLLVEVSDTFGGRSIRVVSGYRTASYYEDSRHKLSSAIDFTVAGVPNEAVRDYLRGPSFERIGVGYYPNSSFLHLDVRGHSAYWVDYAGPGEAPRSSPNAPRVKDRRLLADLDQLLEQTAGSLRRTSVNGANESDSHAPTTSKTFTRPSSSRR